MELPVSGMACDGCEQNVENAVGEVDGVTSVSADHERGAIEVVADGEPDEDAIRSAVENAGYEVVV